MGVAWQVGGAALILIAFVSAQRQVIDVTSWSYLVLNAVGSVILAINALLDLQWGFVLLETVWAFFSFLGIARKLGGGDVPDPAT